MELDGITEKELFNQSIDFMVDAGLDISRQNSLFIKSVKKYIINQDINQLSKAFFNDKNSKQAKLITINQIFKNNNLDFYLANICFFATKANLNLDLIFNFTTKYNENIKTNKNSEQFNFYFSEYSFNLSLFKTSLKYYPEQRILELLSNPLNIDNDSIIDCFKMIQVVEKKSIIYLKEKFPNISKFDFNKKLKEIFPLKPKSLKELHDNLSLILSRFNSDDFDLNQREDIVVLHNKTLQDHDLYIEVPKKHSDLVLLGQKLNFCIGNGTYSKGVLSGNYSIIALYSAKDKKPKYGIQFTRYSVSQAKGFGNSQLPSNILLSIEDLLIKKPELPEDFIPFGPHSFLFGYKYDNSSLFVMFKKGSIYSYENVPHDVYESFLKEKGKCLNSTIKPNYKCIKIF